MIAVLVTRLAPNHSETLIKRGNTANPTQIVRKKRRTKKSCADILNLNKPFGLLSTPAFRLKQANHPSPSVTMGRLHSNGKGISSSAIPYSRTPPAWLKTTPEQVVDQICKLAKKGASPSQIGVILRDSHGIAQVKVVTGMLLRLRLLAWGSALVAFNPLNRGGG